MRSKKLTRDRIQAPHQRKTVNRCKVYEDEEDIGSDYESEKEQQQTKRAAATKRPLLLLLGDEENADDPEKDQEVENADLNSKNECIRQINSTQLQTPKMPKETRFLWSLEATSTLIDLWMANRIDLAASGKKKTPIYKRFAEKLKHFGPNYAEIKSKMDNMSRKYRVEADKVRKSGQPSKWEYFHKIQSCLIGTHSVDVFNEIMFETAEEPEQKASVVTEESSDDEITNFIKLEAKVEEMEQMVEMEEPQEDINDDTEKNFPCSQEDDITNELDETEQTSYSPPVRPKRRKIAHRLFKIEEEKLALEREQLKIMKETSEQLKFFYKDLVRMFKEN